MNEKVSNFLIIMLISKNYHLWIKKLKKLVEQHKIWLYIDFNKNKSKLIIKKILNFFDYTIKLQVTITIRSDVVSEDLIKSTRNISKLIEQDQKDLQQRQSTWLTREKVIKQIEQEIQIMYQAVKISTRSYISFNEMKFNIKNILKTL
jgi:hypothetical protein